MKMSDIMSKFTRGAGGNLIGPIIKQFDKGGTTDFCKKKENPSNALSFNKISQLLNGADFKAGFIRVNTEMILLLQLQANKLVKAQCKKQFDEDKARCEATKKLLCSALDNGDP